jgi:hypothetical protein
MNLRKWSGVEIRNGAGVSDVLLNICCFPDAELLDASQVAD